MMDLSIMGNYLQPLGGRPAQSTAAGMGKSAFTYQLSENHRVINGPGATIPMWTEDTVYYGMDGNNQDVHVTLTEDSTEDDPIVRIKGHSASGEFDFTRHIKDIGREDDACLSFEDQRGVLVPSAEDVVLAPYIEAEQRERRHIMLEQIRTNLTPVQYRRLCLYYLDGKGEAEIAHLENVNQSSVSRAISSGAKIVERFFEDFFRGTA